MGVTLRVLLSLAVALPLVGVEPVPAPADANTSGAEMAMKRFRIAPGLKIELFAAEPLIQNVVSFAFDAQGRAYVVETGRRRTSVFDIRNHPAWLDADFSLRSVEDRAEFLKKNVSDANPVFMEVISRNKRAGFGDLNHDGRIDWHDLEVESERIRLVTDTDGDGRADTATTFSDNYKTLVSGLAAGVLAHGSNVWLTCIPDLWRLQDSDGDGKAEIRQSLHRGFGVHIALGGHDMHGLILGPDGRLYWSIADRGTHVEENGRVLVDLPDMGAVFRSEPDGSKLEVFAYGLRNPQELAFDEFGNLWTCDNNADGGDRARVVYVLPGSDSGWRIGWQWLPKLGAWNSERLWHTSESNTAAYILPPVGHVGRGPSGLAYYPGTGMPASYNRHFLLCDFPDGVRSFSVQSSGAGFAIASDERFLWNLFATDVAFGPNGGAYVSDWVEGWEKTGKGRIYRVFETEATARADSRQTRRLLAEGFEQRSSSELIALLEHVDMRVRQEAQFALVGKSGANVDQLIRTARSSPMQMARIHAIWACAQLERSGTATLDRLVPLLSDTDPEIRAQIARVIGDARVERAAPRLISALQDSEPRVRSLAAISLGRLRSRDAAAPLLQMIETSANDPYLRYAGILGLAGCAADSDLALVVTRPRILGRLASVVALRRHKSPEVANYLRDQDFFVRLEAARAIHDEPIEAALPDLAGQLPKLNEDLQRENPVLFDAFALRVVNAAARVGNARLLADAVQNAPGIAPARAALLALANWAKPPARDPVTGLWRVLPKRDPQEAKDALDPIIADILLRPINDDIKLAALEAVSKLKLQSVGNTVRTLIAARDNAPGLRVEALKTLAVLDYPELRIDLLSASAEGENALVREQAFALRPVPSALWSPQAFFQSLKNRSTAEQRALLANFPSNQIPEASVTALLDGALRGEVPPELHLEIGEIVSRHPGASVKAKLQVWRESSKPGLTNQFLAGFHECLKGGDAARGRKIFFERQDAACLRCHKFSGEGGEVGPDLTAIGKTRSREHILESIVSPNAQVAAGFENTVVTLKTGAVVGGTVKRADAEVLVLQSPEEGLITVKRSQIKREERGLSSMPEEMGSVLSRRELRDLVEFLASGN